MHTAQDVSNLVKSNLCNDNFCQTTKRHSRLNLRVDGQLLKKDVCIYLPVPNIHTNTLYIYKSLYIYSIFIYIYIKIAITLLLQLLKSKFD